MATLTYLQMFPLLRIFGKDSHSSWICFFEHLWWVTGRLPCLCLIIKNPHNMSRCRLPSLQALIKWMKMVIVSFWNKCESCILDKHKKCYIQFVQVTLPSHWLQSFVSDPLRNTSPDSLSTILPLQLSALPFCMTKRGSKFMIAHLKLQQFKDNT